MTALSHARQAYAAAAAPIRTPRNTEYEAISRITSRLRQAVVGNKEVGFAELAEALHANHRLWSLLAAQVADEANELPRGLRAQLFYLAEFTHQHTPKVLAGKAGAEPLLDINTSILRGLRSGEV
ncbi:flagellar biosynthesis regulator FlaF [Lutimaribacter marinistellae]|uniref:Flagellar biosynthesis regulator FlaF n=1 Tax=Lutimaribacter marinistellae TaxID=1820329 RepID=A0ABV7TBT3_9RHOB